MRQHNRYLQKVTEEMDVFRQHLLEDRELTEQQQKTFDKIEIIRGWLRDGFSDTDVIKIAKRDPSLGLMDRRARELLAIAYEIFGELRQARSREGLKFLYSERFLKAAHLIEKKIKALMNVPDDQDIEISQDLTLNLDTSKAKEIALLQREHTRLLVEAAKIDGAYDNSPVAASEKKKPTKIIIKRKTVIGDSGKNSDEITQEAHYEQIQ